jgi:hypothetical protein
MVSMFLAIRLDLVGYLMYLASLQPTVDWCSGSPALRVTYFTGFSCGGVGHWEKWVWASCVNIIRVGPM